MTKKIKLIYLLTLLTLNFSCVEKKSTEKETNRPDLVVNQKTDTLKFTSGIRAIFQDSKGNYWFGSHNEGVSFYNGKSFDYFTTTTSVRVIKQDEVKSFFLAKANI